MDKIKEILVEKLKSKKVIALISGILSGAVFFFIGFMAGTDLYSDDYYDAKEKLETSTEKISELEKKVADAQPWFEMEKEEQRKVEEENARIEAEKLAKEKAEKEEQERLAREEEAKGYDTGITYDQIARTPDTYLKKKVKFRGKVIQVIEGSATNQLRLAVDGNYDKIILVEYVKGLVETRILEDDYVTVSGISQGLITYESTMGSNITIPSVLSVRVEL